MQFDSIEYIALLSVTFAAFHLFSARLRVPILLAASVVFYCSWNAPFIILIAFSAGVDFTAGRRIHAAGDPRVRGRWLLASLVTNLGLLGWFKYADFLRATVSDLLPAAPALAEPWNIVLPIGISFYTFQTMSYSIDVWRGRIEPCRSFVDFLLYVAFFPQLIAGPIERAEHLLPQIVGAKTSRLGRDHLWSGCHLIVWGLFKKLALSDNLALWVNPVYEEPAAASAAALLVATYAFAFQIFFDFSAYSDIARGSAALFGIDLVRNFRLPYLAENPSDFWRRWHVSLSEWIRDYLYIPLGGARRGPTRLLVNLVVTMGLAGLWHGADWHFCAWGLFHGILLVAYRVAGAPLSRLFAPFPEWLVRPLRVALLFHLVCFGWILFRARTLGDAAIIVRGIADGLPSLELVPELIGLLWLFVAFFAIMALEERYDALRRIIATSFGYGALAAGSIVAIALFAPDVSETFIYFQF